MSTRHNKILITGAGGFVGQHAISCLSNDDSTEIVATVEHGQHRNLGVRVVQMDITNAVEVRQVISEECPTHILHLAAVSTKDYADEDPRKAWDVNVTGTQNIALVLVEHLPSCRLIFCSSSEVYGESFRSPRALDETALLKPTTVYGSTKAAADLMIGQMAYNGLHAICVRPFNHFGPGQRPFFVVAAFAQQIARIERGLQKPVLHTGSLDVRRDFLDVRDVVSAYSAIISNFDKLPNGSIFNIASGRAISIQSVLEKLLSLSSVTIDIAIDRSRLRSNEIPVMEGTATKLRKCLGWRPQYQIDSTLAATLEYFRSHSID